MKSLLGRFPFIPRERILALQRYARTLERRRKSRRRIVAFRPYDLDFPAYQIKLTGNVRLFQRSNGRWYVRFTLNGKRFFLSTGERDQNKALLKTLEIVKKAELGKKHDILQDKGISFSELAQEYLSWAEANKSASTVKADKSRIRVLSLHFGNKMLEEITTRDIEQYVLESRKARTPATCNRKLALMKHMFRKAIDWGYVNANPALSVRLLKEPPGRVRYLCETELQRLLDACSGLLKDIVLTTLLTGMRKSELMNLAWDNVNLERREITLKRTKNNEIRTIPICLDLLPVLQRLHTERSTAHCVFSKPDGSPYGNWRKAFENACRNAGITDFRFHDLRHTLASYLAMAGHSAFTIQRLTGHKSIEIAQRYTHLSETYTRQAVDQLGAKVVQFDKGANGQSHK